MEEHLPNETPFKFVIDFFQINLDSHVSFLAFGSTNGMYKFLSDDGIINVFPS